MAPVLLVIGASVALVTLSVIKVALHHINSNRDSNSNSNSDSRVLPDPPTKYSFVIRNRKFEFEFDVARAIPLSADSRKGSSSNSNKDRPKWWEKLTNAKKSDHDEGAADVGLGGYISDRAVDFCSKYGTSLGFDLSSAADCIRPVSLQLQALAREVRQAQLHPKLVCTPFVDVVTERELHLDRNHYRSSVSTEDSQFEGAHSSDSNGNAALPNIHASELLPQYIPTMQIEDEISDFSGYESEIQILDEAEESEEQVSSQDTEGSVAEPSIRIPLEVNGIVYIFEHILRIEVAYSAEELAINFCRSKGMQLGLFPSPDTVKSSDPDHESDEKAFIDVVFKNCVQPLSKALIIHIEDGLYEYRNKENSKVEAAGSVFAASS